MASSRVIHSALLVWALLAVGAACGQDTRFTYQGRLLDTSLPASGPYDIMFTLYGSAAGGGPAAGSIVAEDWPVTDGLFTVALDFGPLPFSDGAPLWLQIEVRPGGSGGGYSLLTPRQPITSAPYAYRAAQADCLDGEHAAFYRNASNLNAGQIGLARLPNDVALLDVEEHFTANQYFNTVGIGTLLPQAPLHVSLGTVGLTAAICEQTDATSEAIAFIGRHDVTDGLGVGVLGEGGATGVLGTVTPTGTGQYYGVSGYATGGDGRNYGLYGVAQEGANNYGGYGHASGTGANNYGLYGYAANGANNYGVRGYASGPLCENYAIYGSASGAESTNWAGYFVGRGYFSSDVGIRTTAPAADLDVNGDALISGSLGIGDTPPAATLGVTTNDSAQPAIYAVNTGLNRAIEADGADIAIWASGGYEAVRAEASTLASGGNAIAVEANAIGDADTYAITGVLGNATSDGAYNYGVRGTASGSNVTNYGLRGTASGASSTNYGVYATASGGSLNYAGYFSGNVHVTGSLSKGGGSFKIDHPLDPENKYLSHSFVESPDMLNIYNGNMQTDVRGYATVVLPDWFEVLNRDFRYQLTVIDEGNGDEFVQAKVVQGVKNNTFTIRTSRPGVVVSWQVTGIRQDPWANAHRIQVEEPKPAAEVGAYLHPELYGQSAERFEAHQLNPDLMTASPPAPAVLAE
jgi:hypothetical protein